MVTWRVNLIGQFWRWMEIVVGEFDFDSLKERSNQL